MKLSLFIISLILISFIYSSCKHNKDCKTSDQPACQGEKCVECVSHEDCPMNKYCVLLGKESDLYKCRKYSEDTDKLGKYCNSEDCSQMDTAVVCGRCKSNSTEHYWTGACINFKCETCRVEDLSGAYSIASQHKETAVCKPKSVSGRAGSLTTAQSTSGVPYGLVQSSHQIGFMCFGFVIFFMLVLQCMIWKRIDV
ncbi:hypothetical protein M0813_21975 [Anaeramoeba flamelloides]|uniref:Uncharacterized protein n=1 Tax=Anaeramoeba flamelloides TaxID=1746091 RepID=A0ABQ8YG47_9EUKA|nr:hypothetical protein M0813_21975 [Anaeramoeba flamelloides]